MPLEAKSLKACFSSNHGHDYHHHSRYNLIPILNLHLSKVREMPMPGWTLPT